MASQTTRDHAAIQRWARARGATPAVVTRTVRSSGPQESALLRFEFSDASAEQLDAVDWSEFFRIFDERGLELIYDDKPGSRFHKFAYPETVAAKAAQASKTSKAAPKAVATAKSARSKASAHKAPSKAAPRSPRRAA